MGMGLLKVVVSNDKERVAEVREGLKITGGYCPCAVVKNADTKCLCKEFREKTEPGKCHCGLYEKVWKAF